MRKKYCTATALLLTTLLMPTSPALAAQPYPVQIRPGFLAGNGSAGNDMNLDFLVPIWGTERSLLFFNPNFRIDNNDGNEQNIGFGFRGMNDSGNFILGGNLFFDTMLSEHSERYQQWGIGAELLSHWLDLRANYYNPFDKTENVIGGSGTPSGYYFSGHSLLASGGLQIEEALKGFDLEASVLIPGLSNVMETRLAATYYKFDADHSIDIEGWRSRLEIRPVKAINLSLEYRDDDVRGGNTFVGGYLEIPLSLENLLAGKNPFAGSSDLFSFGKGVRPLKERMTDKVIRDRHIVTVVNGTQSGAGQAVVDDQMIFVNQDNTNTGDGSYENPYQSLTQATSDSRYQPGAWVYVFSTDTQADTYQNTNFTLLNNMVFWGQGYAHPTYGLGGGSKPILDGGYSGSPVSNYASASVIVLAHANEVMGFTIQNGVEGIYGSNIKGANIHDNLIRSNPNPTTPVDASGIHISNLFSPADVNSQTLNFTISNNQITDNGSVGIYLRNEIDGGGVFSDENKTISNVTNISNVTINNTVNSNILYGNFNSTSDVLANANVYVKNYIHGGGVSGVTINNTFSGNNISPCTGGSCSNTIDIGIKLHNEVDLYAGPNGQSGAIFYGNISDVNFNNLFSGNTISNLGKNANFNSGTAIHIFQDMWGGTITNATSNNTFTSNTLTNNDGAGIYSSTDSIHANDTITNAHHIWNVNGNTLQNNGSYGFHANNDYFSAREDNLINSSTEFYFRNNRVTDNGRLNSYNGDGIYLYVDTSWDQISRKFLMEGNQVNGNYGSGVNYYWNGSNAASMQSDFGGGTLGSTGGNAFYGNAPTKPNCTAPYCLADLKPEDTYFITSAKNNWWGQIGGPVAGQISRPAQVDATSPLSANPFP